RERRVEEPAHRHGMPPDERAVALLDPSLLQRARQRRMRLARLREEDDARGPDVETMDEEELARALLRRREETLHDVVLPAPRPRGGRHRDARELVERDEALVLVEDQFRGPLL